MKTFFTCIIFLALTHIARAQHELYTSCAYTYGVPMNFGGSFFRFDSLGNNMHIIHDFDSVTGAYALGAVIQATNGKLYGLTTRGGVNNEGTLFEYDPMFDSFRVRLDIPQYDMGSYNLLQASDGKIYYVSGGSFQHIMEYDVTANTLTQRAYIPYPKVPTGALTEVSGKLYGLTPLGGASGYGQVFEYNLATQALNYIYDFMMTSGCYPKSQMVQATDGLLYGTTRYTPAGMSDPRYGLYSFNPATHAYVYKMDIPAAIGAADYITAAPNGRIYGMGTYGTDISGNHFGCIFEYTPATNTIRITHNFGNQSYAPPPSGSGYLYTGNLPLGGLRLTSYGKMYGANAYCAFEYDYVTDTVWPRATPIGFQTNSNAWFCELCRKPSYKYFPDDTITRCAATPYSFTVHSDNAKSFQWKKNGITVPTQTDSVLTFASVTITDTGTYTCLMTNQCGTTETITSIRLLVTSAPPAGVIVAPATLCEGATAALSYSVASSGTWASSTAAVATVNAATGMLYAAGAGTTFISYSASGACGTTITSTTVTVSPLPQAGTISGAIGVCQGAVTMLTDNSPGGVWESSNTSTATVSGAGGVTGITAGTVIISYLVTNSCGTAIASHSLAVLAPPVAAAISGPATVCEGTTAVLSNTAAGGTWTSSNTASAIINNSGVITGITAGYTVISYAVANGCGAAVATASVTINPLPHAGSISGSDTICTGDVLQLSSDVSGGAWSIDNAGVATVDASGTLTGTAVGSASITYAVTNSCGTATTTLPVAVQSCTTGVANTVTGSGISIFPNPARHTCTIAVNTPVAGECTLILTNTLGQEVYRTGMSTNKPATISLSIPPGIYNLSAATKDNKYNTRLVIEH